MYPPKWRRRWSLVAKTDKATARNATISNYELPDCAGCKIPRSLFIKMPKKSTSHFYETFLNVCDTVTQTVSKLI